MTVRRLALLAPLLTAAIVVAAPVPKVESDPGPVTKQQFRTGRQRMQELLIGIHSHTDSHNGHFPANMTDGKGNALLSWRVMMLPSLGQEELFKKFDLTEAWDGPNNRKLIDSMPDVFAPARGKTKNSGETFYQGFDGPGAAFQSGTVTRIPASFPDGTANTILLVEASEPVTWTKPEDLAFDAKAATLPKMGGVFDGEFFVGLCDGSVRVALTKHIDNREFRLMVITNDGQNHNHEAALGWERKRR